MYLTQRQAEALWAARERGTALDLYTTERKGGRFIGMLRGLRRYGLLGEGFSLTGLGQENLGLYERRHQPLKPRLCSREAGNN